MFLYFYCDCMILFDLSRWLCQHTTKVLAEKATSFIRDWMSWLIIFARNLAVRGLRALAVGMLSVQIMPRQQAEAKS